MDLFLIRFHPSLREEQEDSVVLEDLLENMETDTFVTLYGQVRTSSLCPGSIPCQPIT